MHPQALHATASGLLPTPSMAVQIPAAKVRSPAQHDAAQINTAFSFFLSFEAFSESHLLVFDGDNTHQLGSSSLADTKVG